jgi:DNA ligase-1
MTISQLFANIEKTAGVTDKSVLMQQALQDANIAPIITQIYQDTYDSQRKYGVHKFQILPIYGNKTLENDYCYFHDLLNKLANRELTGNAAIEAVEVAIAQFVNEDKQILASILNKKLTIGLSKTTFEKLTGTSTQAADFAVTLACLLEKVKDVNPIDGTWYASRKCDGIRTVAKITKNNGSTTVEFISRQGKPITTLDNVKPALQWLVRDLDDGVYYADGEGCIVDANGDEDFQSILKEIRRKDWTIANPCYQLFDFVTEDEFLGKTKSKNFDARYAKMLQMIEGNTFPTIKVLKQEVLNSQADFDRWEKYVSVGNWEGFMLRKNEEFKTGRIKTLLKVKKFLDAEYIVKDLEIAEMTTAEPGLGNVKYTGVKSLIIEHKGSKVNVGSGLTKEQRKEWYADPSKIIGKTVTIKYFEETQDQSGSYSLRFPVLKAVYEDGRTV